MKNRILKHELIDWRKAEWLQGKLKELSAEAKKKLRNSLLKNDFVMPFNVWQDESGVIWILDGHHRQRVMAEIERDGVKLPDVLPANFIECADKKEAARLVLVYSSVYAEATKEGLADFLDEFGLDFNVDNLGDDINIDGLEPDISKDIDAMDEDSELEVPQSVQLEPPKEFVIIVAEPESVEWEQLKAFLRLGIVRSGGYKVGSNSDKTGLERVLTAADFMERAKDACSNPK